MIFTRFVPKAARYSYRWDARAAWLFGLYSGMTVPFFGYLARKMGASDFEMEMLVASTAIGNLIALGVTCLMQGRTKKPFVYWLGMLSRGLLLLMAFVTTRPSFVWLVFLSQLASVLAGPAYASIMKDAYPDNCRGQVMGTVRIGLTLAAMLAGLLAGLMMERGLPWYWVVGAAAVAAVLIAHEIRDNRWRAGAVGGIMLIACVGLPYAAHTLSYRIVFPIAAALGMLSLWMFNHLPEQPVAAEAVTHERTIDSVRHFGATFGGSLTIPFIDWRFGLYCFAFLVFGFGNWLRGPLVPMLQVDELHITKDQVGQLAMVTSGVSLVAYLAWGRLLDRYSPFLTLIIAFLVQGAVAVLFAIATGMPHLLWASVVQGMVGPGVELGSLNAILYFARGEDIPRYMALHSFLVGIRGVIAPFLGTGVFLAIFSLRQCFYVSAVIVWAGFALMALVVWLVLLPHQRAVEAQRHAAARAKSRA